jgi:hypothetical protein
VPDRGNHDLARTGYLVLQAIRVLEHLVDVEFARIGIRASS